MSMTLADHLRALPDRALAAVLSLRPDLIVPVPGDISALATRAQGRVSVARALDPLDQFTLEILDTLRLCREDGPISVEAVLVRTAMARPAPAPALVRAAVDKLRALVLGYGPGDGLHLAAGRPPRHWWGRRRKGCAGFSGSGGGTGGCPGPRGARGRARRTPRGWAGRPPCSTGKSRRCAPTRPGCAGRYWRHRPPPVRSWT